MKTPLSHNFLVSKLFKLFYLSKSKKLSSFVFSNWFPYLYYRNPLNLLFSSDQFLYEFLLKYPQRKKISAYKIQLKEQKKLNLFYGYLSRKQLQKYFSQTDNFQGEFSKNFINLLERRLDVILYRSQFVKNIPTARQLISHKKVIVNNKIISTPSYLAKPGDIISIKNNHRINLYTQITANLKSQNLFFSLSELHVNPWKLKNKFIPKKQIESLTSLIVKKISSRSQIQKYNNAFSSHLENFKYSQFHIYKISQSSGFEKSKHAEMKESILKEQKHHQLMPQSSKKIVLKILSHFHFENLSKKIFFLRLKKNLRKNSSKTNILSYLNYFGMKPMHLEISYKLFTLIFLYSPQRIYYPFTINFDLIKRAQFQ
jgi:small subunit ribosomal protein S4